MAKAKRVDPEMQEINDWNSLEDDYKLEYFNKIMNQYSLEEIERLLPDKEAS